MLVLGEKRAINIIAYGGEGVQIRALGCTNSGDRCTDSGNRCTDSGNYPQSKRDSYPQEVPAICNTIKLLKEYWFSIEMW